MAKDVYMPALGMNQDTGTLLRWIKAEGDTVARGEPLMEVATDKTDVEIEASADGVLGNVTAQAGDEVPVGQVIAQIFAPGETIPPAEAKPIESRQDESERIEEDASSGDPTPNTLIPHPSSFIPPISPVAARVAAEHGVDVSRIQPRGGRIQKEDVLAYVAARTQGKAIGQTAPGGIPRILASPKARRLAQEAGVDLATVAGSGPAGAVLAADVEAALQATIEAPSPASVPPDVEAPDGEGDAPIAMSRMWKVMAQRLTESWTTVPHFYLTRDVEATQLVDWRTDLLRRLSAKVSYTDLLVKLTAAALRKHPRVNAAWREGEIVSNAGVHIGLAVAVEDGLLVPVLHNADRQGLSELATRRAELVQAAQRGTLALEDLQGGTFTISNLGMYGVDRFNAIVNPPQAAILAGGRMAERIVVVDGAPAVRTMMTLTLSCDHRIVDGARAAQFLDTLAAYVEEPLRVLE